VVYEMLTGRTPFHSDTPVGYLRMHMQETPPPFRAVKPDLPALPQLESVVMKALVKDRDQRYASALDFARAFAAAQTTAAAEFSQPLPSTKIVAPPAAREPVASLPVSASARAPVDIAVQTPPPAPPQRVVEPPRPQPVRSEPTPAVIRPPAVSKPPRFRTISQPSSKMKYAVIAVVALILIVAGVWYFSPSAHAPVVKPPSESGGPQPGAGQQNPVVQTPAPPLQSPIERGTNAADRRKQVEAAKRQGDLYYDNGEYDKAINAYRAGLKVEPSNAQLVQALQHAQTAKAAEAKFNQ